MNVKMKKNRGSSHTITKMGLILCVINNEKKNMNFTQHD